MPSAPISAAAADYAIHDLGLRHTPTTFEKGEKDWSLNPAKEGTDYDDCPNPSCGQRDVPLAYKSGGKTIRYGEEHRDWSMFTCPCCRTTWDRTTKQGQARNETRNVHTRRLTGAAATGRFVSVPSRRFSANYERAFGHR